MASPLMARMPTSSSTERDNQEVANFVILCSFTPSGSTSCFGEVFKTNRLKTL